MGKFAEIVITALKAREKELRKRAAKYENAIETLREMTTADERRGTLAGDTLATDGEFYEAVARLSIYTDAANYTPDKIPEIRKYYQERGEIAAQVIRAFDGIDGAAAFRRVKERFVIQECTRALFMFDGLDDMTKNGDKKGAVQNA